MYQTIRYINGIYIVQLCIKRNLTVIGTYNLAVCEISRNSRIDSMGLSVVEKFSGIT